MPNLYALDYVRENTVSLVLSPVTTVECLGVIKYLYNIKTDIIIIKTACIIPIYKKVQAIRMLTTLNKAFKIIDPQKAVRVCNFPFPRFS